MPKISVISPVYNAEKYLDTCLASCLTQTLDDIELIFVDDGSTDGSLALMNDAASRDDRLIVLSQENAGASAARNLALEHARGEFAFFIDSDDYIPERTALERLYFAATSNGVPVAGGSMCIDRGGKLSFDALHGRDRDSFEREEVVRYEDYQYDYDFTRYIYSIELLREHGVTFPIRGQFEDPIFFVNAMLAAGSFATISDAVYAYRYGYKRRQWSEQAIVERLDGMMELLALSSKLGYAKLHAYVAEQLDTELSAPLMGFVKNDRVMSKLYKANGMVDTELIQKARPGFPDVYVIEPLRWINAGYARYRIVGRLISNRYTLAARRLIKKLMGKNPKSALWQ